MLGLLDLGEFSEQGFGGTTVQGVFDMLFQVIDIAAREDPIILLPTLRIPHAAGILEKLVEGFFVKPLGHGAQNLCERKVNLAKLARIWRTSVKPGQNGILAVDRLGQ